MPEPLVLSELEATLKAQFDPQVLKLEDETHQHRKHAQFQEGKHHLHVTIQAACLQELTPIAAHRAIYQALAPWIPSRIHALRITLA